jgi:hypothetical protein
MMDRLTTKLNIYISKWLITLLDKKFTPENLLSTIEHGNKLTLVNTY